MTRVAMAMLAGILLCWSAQGLHAEQATDEAEAKEAAEEEAAQRKRENELDRPISSYIVGMLVLKSKEERGDGKGVIGTLQTKAKDYQLKAGNPELIAQLEKLNGKRVKLRGNPRNKEKYFVVQDGQLAAATDK